MFGPRLQVRVPLYSTSAILSGKKALREGTAPPAKNISLANSRIAQWISAH